MNITNVVRVFIVALIGFSLVGLTIILLEMFKLSPFPLLKINISPEKITLLVNIVVVFIMVSAVLVTISYSTQQIEESRTSTNIQVAKMHEQIKAIGDSTQRHIDNLEQAEKKRKGALLSALLLEHEMNIKVMNDFIKSKGKEAKKLYFFYTTCPKCAKVYGKNYTVLLAQV